MSLKVSNFRLPKGSGFCQTSREWWVEKKKVRAMEIALLLLLLLLSATAEIFLRPRRLQRTTPRPGLVRAISGLDTIVTSVTQGTVP